MELIKQNFNYGTNSDIPSLWASMGYIYGHCARQLYYTNKYGYNGFTSKDMEMMESGKETHELVESWFKNTYPDLALEAEVKKSFAIEIPFFESEHFDTESPKRLTPFIIGAKADLIAHLHPNLQRQDMPPSLIEIKYLYGRSAYYQTLIEKLVFYKQYDRDILIKCFQYANLLHLSKSQQEATIKGSNSKPDNFYTKHLLIPIKADINMAIVYAGRIITALYHMPPRFPGARYGHPTCAKCIHRELCYTDTESLTGDTIADLDAWLTFKRQSQPYIDAVRHIIKPDSI